MKASLLPQLLFNTFSQCLGSHQVNNSVLPQLSNASSLRLAHLVLRAYFNILSEASMEVTWKPSSRSMIESILGKPMPKKEVAHRDSKCFHVCVTPCHKLDPKQFCSFCSWVGLWWMSCSFLSLSSCHRCKPPILSQLFRQHIGLLNLRQLYRAILSGRHYQPWLRNDLYSFQVTHFINISLWNSTR